MIESNCIQCKTQFDKTELNQCPNCGNPTLDSESPTQTTGFSLEKFTSSLSNKQFQWLWLSNTFSFLAMNTHMTIRSWLVLELPEFNIIFTTIVNPDFAPLALVIALMSFSLPIILTSFIGGLLADRMSRKLLIMLAISGNVIMALTVASLDYFELIEYWHLIVLGMGQGAMMAFTMPSQQAMISDVIPDRNLMNAISTISAARNFTRIIGPIMAGFLIAWIETHGAFLVVAACYGAAFLSISIINVQRRPSSKQPTKMSEDFKATFSYVAGHQVLPAMLFMTFIPVLFGFSLWPLLPAWGKEVLSIGPEGLGWLNGAQGIGAVIGSLILAALTLKKRGRVMLLICLIWGLILAVFAYTNTMPSALAMLILIGALSGIFLALNTTLLQTYTSHDMRGRVMSISMMMWGIMPLSAVPFGIIATTTGSTPLSLGLSGILLVICTSVFWIYKPSFTKID